MNKNIEKLFEEVQTTIAKKDADYGSSFEKGYNSFGYNYAIGVMTTKLDRILNLLKGNEAEVTSEKIEDSIKDLIGYSALLYDILVRKDVIKLEEEEEEEIDEDIIKNVTMAILVKSSVEIAQQTDFKVLLTPDDFEIIIDERGVGVSIDVENIERFGLPFEEIRELITKVVHAEANALEELLK